MTYCVPDGTLNRGYIFSTDMMFLTEHFKRHNFFLNENKKVKSQKQPSSLDSKDEIPQFQYGFEMLDCFNCGNCEIDVVFGYFFIVHILPVRTSELNP